MLLWTLVLDAYKNRDGNRKLYFQTSVLYPYRILANIRQWCTETLISTCELATFRHQRIRSYGCCQAFSFFALTCLAHVAFCLFSHQVPIETKESVGDVFRMFNSLLRVCVIVPVYSISDVITSTPHGAISDELHILTVHQWQFTWQITYHCVQRVTFCIGIVALRSFISSWYLSSVWPTVMSCSTCFRTLQSFLEICSNTWWVFQDRQLFSQAGLWIIVKFISSVVHFHLIFFGAWGVKMEGTYGVR